VGEVAETVRKEAVQRGRGASPLVSVVIPAYNCAAFIGEALESIYRQTYKHWEIIVVDDGSTDATSSALAPHLGRIRYIAQENGGTAAARNAGLRRAQGELIAFLDNDDVWLPDKLELQVRVMQAWPECGLVFTDGKQFTEAGVRQESVISRRLDAWLDAHGTHDPLVAKGWMVRELLFSNEIASASSVMVRRESLERVGGFDEEIAIADDYDLWLRVAGEHPVGLIRRCLYMWRWHDGSQSGPIAERQYRWMAARLMVLEKHLPLVPADVRTPLRAHMARLYWECARYYFGLDQFRASRRMLVGCLRHNRIFLPATALLLVSCLGSSTVHGMRRMKAGVRGWSRRVRTRLGWFGSSEGA
jgi:glycosyltransferase involved in cell wall biosynthesis